MSAVINKEVLLTKIKEALKAGNRGDLGRALN